MPAGGIDIPEEELDDAQVALHLGMGRRAVGGHAQPDQPLLQAVALGHDQAQHMGASRMSGVQLKSGVARVLAGGVVLAQDLGPGELIIGFDHIRAERRRCLEGQPRLIEPPGFEMATAFLDVALGQDQTVHGIGHLGGCSLTHARSGDARPLP